MAANLRRLGPLLLGKRRYYALEDAHAAYKRASIGWNASDPRKRISQERIRSLRNTHVGQRCFIIGNGPSLRDMDLSVLRNEITFGMNRIYLLFPEWGFQTTYHVTVNDLVIEQCAEDILGLTMPRFLSWSARDHVALREDMMFIRRDPLVCFATDIVDGLWGGGTVTYAAMQIAYYLGFSDVVLIGVDHSFVTKGPANKTVVSRGGDPNHFSAAYFGKGFKWQLPDLELSELAYRMAKCAFEGAGRRIVDATVDGKLQVFPKVDFGSLFPE